MQVAEIAQIGTVKFRLIRVFRLFEFDVDKLSVRVPFASFENSGLLGCLLWFWLFSSRLGCSDLLGAISASLDTTLSLRLILDWTTDWVFALLTDLWLFLRLIIL